MYLHQATRDPLWISVGLEFLASIEHSAWTPCGYAIVSNVSTHELGDRMESFYLSETLKYLCVQLRGFWHDFMHHIDHAQSRVCVDVSDMHYQSNGLVSDGHILA